MPMADDRWATQREPDIAAELSAAGFDDAVEIGRGGFGVVYRCLHDAVDRTVAVKVLTTDLDHENLARFVREQRAMGRMSGHPNIVDLYQVGVTRSNRPFLVMPYHEHGSLDAQIRSTGPIGWEPTVRLGIKIAGALETAHRAGTLHRDVKPANILLTEYDEPQLTDFGIARVSGGFETASGSITGSPPSPRPRSSKADRRPPRQTYTVSDRLCFARSPGTPRSSDSVVNKSLHNSSVSPRSRSRICESPEYQRTCARRWNGRWPVPWRIGSTAPPLSATNFAPWSAGMTWLSIECRYHNNVPLSRTEARSPPERHNGDLQKPHHGLVRAPTGCKLHERPLPR